MEQHLQRYALGVGGASFVIVGAVLGWKTALVATVCAVLAANWQRLAGVIQDRRRRPLPVRQRAALRARPLREEGDDELPLVPDEPSLVLSTNGY